MKEIRKLTGVTLPQLNALFLAVDEIDRLQKSMEATLPDGKLCAFIYYENSGCNFWLGIQKVQLQSGQEALFRVQLRIEGQFQGKVLYDDTLEKVQLAMRWSNWRYEKEWKESGSPKVQNGVLYVRPAISSHIDYALGLVEEVEPLYVFPKD